MKTYLFIDGTNLYASQYELFGPQKYLNFSKFIEEIEKKIKVKFNKIYFYASYTPKKKKTTKKEKLYIVNEFQFYKSVKNSKRVKFFKGYRSKTSGKEKEVDVIPEHPMKRTADFVTSWDNAETIAENDEKNKGLQRRGIKNQTTSWGDSYWEGKSEPPFSIRDKYTKPPLPEITK